MIGRSQHLVRSDPRLIDLDRERMRARIAAVPLPAVPPSTGALMRREALDRLDREPPPQHGPDGHRIIRGRGR